METQTTELNPELNAKKLLSDLLGQANSLIVAITTYKQKNDNSVGNKRKSTSDFLQNLMTALQTSKLDDVTKCYNLLLALLYVLQAQRNKATDDDLDKSEFIKAILSSLSKILFETTVKFRKISTFDKGSKLRKQSAIDNCIQRIDEWLDHFSTTCTPETSLKKDGSLSAAVQGLFDYCAEKELDAKSKLGKRVQIYKVLELYFKAQTANDYVSLFEEIANGIQVSRTQGINGEKSRGSEHALVAFRDWLVYKLFVDTDSNNLIKFDKTQIEKILDQISYKLLGKNKGDKTDVDVSRYTLEMINLLNNKNPKELNSLRIEHIKRLMFQIPNEINNSKIDKAQYCFDKGPAFATAMAQLLSDSTLSTQQQLEVAACAYMWNKHMVDLVAKQEKVTLDYMVIIPSDIDPRAIQRHALLEPLKLKKEEFNHYYIENQSLIAQLSTSSKPQNKQEQGMDTSIRVLNSSNLGLKTTPTNSETPQNKDEITEQMIKEKLENDSAFKEYHDMNNETYSAEELYRAFYLSKTTAQYQA